MARQYRILHHRQSLSGGHWDLTENPIPIRPGSSGAHVPQGSGSLCSALEALDAEGWVPVIDLHAQAQPGETFILLMRE